MNNNLGPFYVVASFLLLIVAFVWILFPFLMLSKAGQIVKLLTSLDNRVKSLEQLGEIEYRKKSTPPPSINAPIVTARTSCPNCGATIDVDVTATETKCYHCGVVSKIEK